jgi:hypothetical protein
MLCPPGHPFAESNQPGRHPARRHRLFPPVDVSGQMDFHTPSEVETAFDGCPDDRDFFESYHSRTRRRQELNTFKLSMRLVFHDVKAF